MNNEITREIFRRYNFDGFNSFTQMIHFLPRYEYIKELVHWEISHITVQKALQSVQCWDGDSFKGSCLIMNIKMKSISGDLLIDLNLIIENFFSWHKTLFQAHCKPYKAFIWFNLSKIELMRKNLWLKTGFEDFSKYNLHIWPRNVVQGHCKTFT